MLLRRRLSIGKLLKEYSIEPFTELEYPELRKYLRALVLDTEGREIGWIKEVRVRKKDKKVVEVAIERSDGRSLRVDPRLLVIYRGNLFLLEELSEEALQKLVKLVNNTEGPSINEGVLRKLTGEEGAVKTTIEFLSAMEKELKSQLNELVTQWFMGKLSLDDFMDRSQSVRSKLERVRSVKEALKGIVLNDDVNN
ncbi:MAG: hypothetical protein B6U69_01870 [Thermofilum sp. ex4484_15]|nr:MAG: hypothetical protein B6U69_01870 [Thermofilum sp. ex4484_15]